jgi:Zn-dependent peptidase ImmA (M78 family)
MLRHVPDWNRRVLSEADAIKYCEKSAVITIETDLIDDLGEFKFYKEKPFILIHKYIAENYRGWVYWHEFAHFLLHPVGIAKFSDSRTKRKIEKEAHFVAAIALMPTFILKQKTLAEIQEEFGYPLQLIQLRKWIYDTYKI